jgi:hypothetical protein
MMELVLDAVDAEAFQEFLDGMGRRIARAELLPKLKDALDPIAAAGRAMIDSKSGALAKGLKARSGGGDRPGTISVYSKPTATKKQVVAKWSAGRKQQRGWAAKLADSNAKGRVRVFYGNIVHQGHRIVKRRPMGHPQEGQLYDTGKRARPVPFAAEPMAAMGEAQSEAAAEAVMRHIFL